MRSVLSSALVCVAATSAFAQAPEPVSDDMPPNRCEEFLKGIDVLKPGEGFAVREIPDGCIVSNSVYQAMSMMGWKTDRLVIELDRLQDYLSDAPDLSGSPPQWGRIVVDGARLALQTSSKMSNYISSVQQWPLDFAASYRFNAQTGYLHIQNAEISSTKLGKVSFSAEINVPVGSSVATLAANPTAMLTHLRLRLDNQGLWESVALPTLANYAAQPSETGESDPEVDIARLRDIAGKAVEALPDSQIDAGSRKALLRFVQDMPNPTGFFTMDVHFDTPLPLELGDLEPQKLAQRALAGTTMSVSYTAR